MRDLIFKGMTTTLKGNGDWVYGGFYKDSNGRTYIVSDAKCGPPIMMLKAVNPETVCQFTGLKDKNDEKIFEGDIVRDKFGRIEVVKFHEGRFHPFIAFPEYKCWLEWECEVIGNIHNDPDILK